MTTPSEPPPLPPPPVPGDGATDWLRQHPLALVFNLLQSVRVIPLLVLVVMIRGPYQASVIWLILLVNIAAACLRYWRFRYRFTRHELVVEQGWLHRQVRHIPYTRIQNINITRKLFHRPFGLSGLQLESASGSEPEAVMHALSNAAMAEFHARIEAAKEGLEPDWETTESDRLETQPGTSTREPRRQILRLGIGELAKHGLISNRAVVLIATMIGFLFQGPLADHIIPLFVGWLSSVSHANGTPAGMAATAGPFLTFLFGFATFLAAIFALAGLSAVYAIVRYHDFTLSADSQTLRAEFGLFTRVAIMIPKGRIQAIGLRTNPFHRLFRRVSITVETAGASGGDDSSSTLKWLAPILPDSEVQRVLMEVRPELAENYQWQPLHPRAAARLIRIRLVGVGLLGLFLALLWGAAGLLALLLIPLVVAHGVGYFRHAGWATTATTLAHRSGWLVKQQRIVPYQKIQVLSLTRTPFDRRWGMATLSVDTAGADPRGHRVRIRLMADDPARGLLDFLEEQTHQTRFTWA